MSNREVHQEALRWLRFATEDLQTAQALLSDERCIARHVCWLAQQAAEKALKAVLVDCALTFPRTHDLDILKNLLPDNATTRTSNLDVTALTEWAVEARYPGDWEEASLADAHAAVADAAAVVDVARHAVQQPP